MDPAPHTPTAGQATVEYVAVITLMALLLAFAAPAVGAPDLGRLIGHKLRLGICLVARDVCSAAAAKAQALPPCTLNARTDGHALAVTIFSIDLGGNESVTVAPQSDGSYAVSATAGVSSGLSGGLGEDLTEGPVRLSIGASGSVDARVQAGRGWTFPDAASAQRFVDALPHSALDAKRFPPAWHSAENVGDAYAGLGLGAGHRAPGQGEEEPETDLSADLALAGVSLARTFGARTARDGTVTLYAKGYYEAEASVPFVPSVGPGPHTYSVEVSLRHGTARELVLRTASPGDRGNRLTDTALHLDLTDPANLALAKRLISSPGPGAFDAVVERVHQVGLIERSVSEFSDNSTSVSGAVKLGLKLGGVYKRITVHKHLVSATAEVAGEVRDRYDCEVANGGG